MKAMERKFIFVVGAPRSGTSWLHEMISVHPLVASNAPNELTHFSTYIHPLLNTWEKQVETKKNNSFEIGLPTVWNKQEFEDFLSDFTEKVYSKLTEKNPAATHIIDKHPNYSNYLKDIWRVIPNAKVIHIIRDPREVAISSVSVRKRVGFMHDNVRDMSMKWEKFTANAMKSKGEKNYLELRYEDLKKNTDKNLETVFKFCGLNLSIEEIQKIAVDFSDKKLSSANTDVDHLRDDKLKLYSSQLSLKERLVIHAITFPLAKKLGYFENDSWVCNSFSDRMKIPFLKLKLKLNGK